MCGINDDFSSSFLLCHRNVDFTREGEKRMAFGIVGVGPKMMKEDLGDREREQGGFSTYSAACVKVNPIKV